MNIESWLLFSLAITIASISPGPNVLIVVTHSLRYGWKNTLATIFGNIIALFVIAVIASLGVSSILNANPVVFSILKSVGALYLIYMGIKILLATRKIGSIFEDMPNQTEQSAPHRKMAMEAILISASNPKAVIFLSALFPHFLDIGQPIIPQFSLMFGTIILIVTCIHLGYARMAAYIKTSFTNRVRKNISIASGAGFVAIGSGLLLDEYR